MLALFALVGIVLLSVPALAKADPYPPTNPSSGIAPSSASRAPETTVTHRESSNTANTGFATLTATGIAIALLGGGIVFVVAGRRRRRA